jgi:hypothetical protein
MRKATVFAVTALLLVAAACQDKGGTSVPKNPSTAHEMAVINGDPSEEAAFQNVIDCVMASGIQGAETEEKVGDTLFASWNAGGKPGTLLEWSQAFC